MVSDGCEINQDDQLVNYIMSNNWEIYLKLIQYYMSPVIENFLDYFLKRNIFLKLECRI